MTRCHLCAVTKEGSAANDCGKMGRFGVFIGLIIGPIIGRR
jgi:hypothetical protein